ncbi:MAG: twin-arginine translocase TatA/TatE family subunit [Anaerolineales bacterium]|jgi:sec-independent protein translocase protein TatA|nr:twin-arginine translocase TatA/TatE family subunit [Anaerolineales bacterium]
MPFSLGTTELIIILVIVIILFGVGRIGRLGQDFGRAISEFRKATREQDDLSDNQKETKSENTHNGS